jgi:anthranilate phosphoribosyltransferase
MLLLNAGMALVAAGQAADLASGMDAARDAIDGGAAARTLERLRAASHAG